MKKVNIGLIGFGVVGSGVYSVITKNRSIMEKRTGVSVECTIICDRNIDKVKKEAPGVPATDSWEEVVTNASVDIVVELIGGIEPAQSIITTALSHGKSVVTANKKLLAENGEEIFRLADGEGVSLGYEAAIGGGIPCVMGLKQGMVANNIKSILGILNGTTNYILTKMAEQELPFDQVLKDAQEKGFAEADPTFDIEGNDAGHKISLLAQIAYGKKVDYHTVPIRGITSITSDDIDFAREMGYTIKLLGIARMMNEGLDIRVHPAMVPENHLLASVGNEFNAVYFDGDMTDPVIFYGKGAGSHPTASAVVSDIILIAQGAMNWQPLDGEAHFVDAAHRELRYYMRIQTDDKPGILSKISGVFGSHGISISNVIQRESGSGTVPLIIMTHLSSEASVMDAVAEIESYDFVYDRINIIPVEED